MLDNPHYQQALSYLSKHEPIAAIQTLKVAIQQSPQCYPAWLLLSKTLFEQGAFTEAFIVSEQAERFDPLVSDFQAIQVCMQNRQFIQARRLAYQMIDKVQAHPRAYFTLAHIAQSEQKYSEAKRCLHEALDALPANLMLRNMLISCEEALGDYSDAIANAKTLVKTKASFDTYWVLINLLLKNTQYEAVLDACREAHNYVNKEAYKLSQLRRVEGQVHRILGDSKASVASFETSLSLYPSNGETWWALADLKTHQFTEDDISQLAEHVANPSISPQQICLLRFTLAKALESNHGIAHAFPFYELANKAFPSKNYHHVLVEKEFNARKLAFNQSCLSIQAEPNKEQPRPIFIVGLPRSGSTLIEQILASHSQIEGTLEQATLAAVERQAREYCLTQYQQDLMSSINQLSPSVLSDLGQAYVDKGALYRQQRTAFYIDKLPFNFRHIGLIHKILPHAIIIDVRRNPMDCGLSLFKQFFHSGVDFSYDLSNIAKFYNAYEDLMQHWEQVLPSKVYRLQYEALVLAPEQSIRSVLAHIGLEYEPACMAFHLNKRQVHTASSEQVRQALYSKSMGLWRQCQDSLRPLYNGLNQTVLDANEPYL